jgi:AraC-like DNA-binding protein
MDRSGTILASLPRATYDTLSSYQINAAALAAEAGLDSEKLIAGRGRVSESAVVRFIRLALQATGDPCLALSVAAHARPTTFSALGFSWLASPTLREVFQRLARYHRLLLTSNSMRLEWDDEHGLLRLYFAQQDQQVNSFRADTAFAVMVRWCRGLARDDFAPTRIEFRHADHGQAHRYQDHFQAPITFGAAVDCLTLPAGALDEILPGANQVLAVDADRIVEGYIAALDKSDVALQVHRRLLDLLPQGEASIDKVAGRLHMSRRTLQRHLADEGQTFRGLVDETRKTLAIEYVRNGKYPLVEVAFRLGFGDHSSFTKAFRRWTGLSPSQFR